MPAPERKGKSLVALMKSSKASAKEKPRFATPAQPASQTLVVKSISLTSTAEETLTAFMRTAREQMGRKVSASSVVRALLALAEREQLDVAAAIEVELNTGSVVWGSRRGS